MAVPYAFWPGMSAPPPGGIPTPLMVPPPMQPPPMMLPGMWGSGMSYGIPAIPPSAKWVQQTARRGRAAADASPLITDPAGAIRDFTEHATNADRKQMCTVWDLQCLADWGKDEEHRKAIMGVIKARLDLPWPHNYKALDVLSVMPVSEYVGLIDKLKGIADSPASVEGAAELKKIVKPILEKAEGEKKKAEEEEMKKRQDAITAMWGGLWANGGAKAPGGLAQAGWYGWQYPYQVVPGVPAQAQISWNSKAPEGWTPYVLAPVSYGSYPVLGWPRPA